MGYLLLTINALQHIKRARIHNHCVHKSPYSQTFHQYNKEHSRGVTVEKLLVLLRPATPVTWLKVPTYIVSDPKHNGDTNLVPNIHLTLEIAPIILLILFPSAVQRLILQLKSARTCSVAKWPTCLEHLLYLSGCRCRWDEVEAFERWTTSTTWC